MGAMASQIASLTIVYSSVDSVADERKHQSSVSLAFVTGEFPVKMASNAENDSIWWRHHDFDWIGLHLFNDDTLPAGHVSRRAHCAGNPVVVIGGLALQTTSNAKAFPCYAV